MPIKSVKKRIFETPGLLPPAYGAAELKSLYGPNLMVGLAIAIIVHMALIGLYALSQAYGESEPPAVHVRLLPYSQLGPPPSITGGSVPPAVALSTPAAKQNAGVPVPVPDIEVSAEQALATQQEMNRGSGGEGVGEGGTGGGSGDIRIEGGDAPPADFAEVEKEPVIVKSVEPRYPEMAVRTGLEGTVWVKIQVDREGHAKQVVILRSDNEIFNQPALEAAHQFVFTPAYSNDGPVPVWVTFPFRFELSGRN